jgi:hypothetical protein
MYHFINEMFIGNIFKLKNIRLHAEAPQMYAKAERPTLTKRPKASIWLVRHHLRSFNTVNKEHYSQTRL